jgi:hypothetical protein
MAAFCPEMPHTRCGLNQVREFRKGYFSISVAGQDPSNLTLVIGTTSPTLFLEQTNGRFINPAVLRTPVTSACGAAPAHREPL